jgi:5'-3' exoribonuclease 1
MHPVNQKLLPENYRSLLTDPQSPLRVPIDYYPDTFDVDPYGGLYEHEYICILPFIDSEMIDKVY